MSSNPFEDWEAVMEADWSAEHERAWQVFRQADQGDDVIWGSRKQPLTVNDRSQTDGLVELDVEGPRGGSYTIRERYEMGEPAYYADDSKANDLRFSDDSDSSARLSSSEYDALLRTLETRSLNVYQSGDYASYDDAVRSVVEEWASDVQFARWEDMDTREDRLPIFKSIIQHTPVLESEYPSGPPRNRAEHMLVDTLVERSQRDADLALVRDEDSYHAYVDTVANDAVDRLESNRYDSAVVAVRDAVSRELEDRSQEFYRNIIQYSTRDPMEYDYYVDVEEDNQYREMAWDVLHDDVLEEVRQRRRERGQHDPRPAGLRFDQHDMMVEALTEETLREHRINNHKLVRTTAEDVVETWASDVEGGAWDPGFEEFDATDADDIFASAVLHSEYEPSSFNPFSQRGEREMAEEVVLNEVADRAEQAMTEDREHVQPIPADEYLDDELGLGITYKELRDDTDLTPEEFVRDAIANYSGDLDALAGWTFIDELVDVGEYNVPQVSNEWVLVDYGLVHERDRTRQAAWFHRETGNVLVLAGETTNPPERGEYEYLEFNVFLQRWNDAEGPEFLVSDAPIHECMEYVYDYIGGNRSDVRVIETQAGEYYVQDALEREKLDGESMVSNFLPGLAIPGSGWVPERVKRAGKSWFSNVSETAAAKMDLQKDAARFSILLFMEYTPYFTQRFLAGLKATPMYDRRKGAGVRLQMDFGKDAEEDGVGGDAEANIYVRPETMRRWRNALTPSWMKLGDPDADLTQVQQTWDDIVEAVTDNVVGDSVYRGRARFLMLHLPPDPRGMPQERVRRKSRRWALEHSDDPAANGRNPWYTLEPGETLDDDELERRIEYAEEHGVEKVFLPNEHMDEDGLLTLDDLRDHDGLPVELAEEVGYSLSFDNVFEYFGTEQDVNSGFAAGSYKTFLDLYEEFRYVPQKGVVNSAFQWLVEESRRSEDFTFVDAYDMFRSNIVYNEVEHERNTLIRSAIEHNDIGADRLFEDDVEDTQYIWQPVDADLRRAWEGAEVDSEQILFPAGTEGYGATLYWGINERGDPEDFLDGIDYSLWRANERRDDGADRFDEQDYRQEVTGPSAGPARNFVEIRSYDELWWHMSDEAKQFIIDQMGDLAENLPHDGMSWEDMDGVSLDVSGLFMRGLDAAGVTGRGNFLDKSRMFPLSLNDVPGVNISPERPEVPSFPEWRQRRYGPGYDGTVPSDAEQRARYMDEIEEYVAPDPLDEMGVSMEAEFESDAQREAASFEGDYQDYESFYAEEFGESFEDVADKFNRDGLPGGHDDS